MKTKEKWIACLGAALFAFSMAQASTVYWFAPTVNQWTGLMYDKTAWHKQVDGGEITAVTDAFDAPMAHIQEDGTFTEGFDVIYDYNYATTVLGAHTSRMPNWGINSYYTKIGNLTFQNVSNKNVNFYAQNNNTAASGWGYGEKENATDTKNVDASIWTTQEVRDTLYSIRTLEVNNLSYVANLDYMSNTVNITSQADNAAYRLSVIINGDVTVGSEDALSWAGNLNFGSNGSKIPAVLHSLTVKGDYNMYGETHSIWNVCKELNRTQDQINFDKEYYYGEGVDLKIDGVINFYGDGKNQPNIFFNISQTYTEYGTYNSIYSIGGLNGLGNFYATGGASGSATIIFTNAAGTSCKFEGGYGDEEASNFTMKIVMKGAEDSRQELNNTWAGTNGGIKGGIEIISGTLALHMANAEVSQMGDIEISGGTLEIITNSAAKSDSYAHVFGKDLLWSGGTIKTENLSIDGTGLIQLAGGFEILGDGERIFDFSGSVLDTGVQYIIATWADDSLQEDDLSRIKVVADGYDVLLELGGNSLYATFTAIPEPAAMAALLGVAALGLAVLRRRK